MRVLLCILAFALTAPASAQQVDPDRLKDLETQAEESKARQEQLEAEAAEAAAEIASIQEQMVSLAAQSEAYEREAQEIEARLSELRAEEQRLEADLYEDRAALADILAALQRIERHPPPTLATHPEDAVDAARAATLLASITDELQIRANALSERLENLALVQDAIETKQAELLESRQALGDQRAEMESLLEDKRRLEQKLLADSREESDKYEQIAAEASDLQELIARLETEASNVMPRIKPGPPSFNTRASGDVPVPRVKPRRSQPSASISLPPETGRFSDARGRLRPPATGRVVESYGTPQTDGSRATGLTLETGGGAQVIAPFAGRIEFAGEFKHYGNVLIMNVGDGYFITLAGLGRIHGREGDMVLAGEPVGNMPAAARNSPELYIEFRRNGQPVNPAPWMGTALASDR